MTTALSVSSSFAHARHVVDAMLRSFPALALRTRPCWPNTRRRLRFLTYLAWSTDCVDLSNSSDALSGGCVKVARDVISAAEEARLVAEVDKSLQRQRYRGDHWDGVICAYREVEKHHWDDQENLEIVSAARRAIDPNVTSWLPVHVIDLAEQGEITAHIDSVKFSGGIVAGISLLSSAVMTLEHETRSDDIAHIHLPPRSLYVLSGAARYEFTHRVGSERFRDEAPVVRGRRVSLIFRDAKMEGQTTRPG